MARNVPAHAATTGVSMAAGGTESAVVLLLAAAGLFSRH